MNFSQRQADPRRHLVGITLVILFHVLIVWALVSGLAKKVVQVVIAPIETKVIEEVKKPPPPPEVVVPPPPKLEAPPPPFIPPPEVQITAPPPPPTITATTPTPPPAPVVIAPAPPVVAPPAPVAAPPAPPAPPPPKPAIQQAGVACSKMTPPELPAVNTEVEGSIFVLATLKAGRVVQVEIERNTLRGVADRRVMRSFINNIETAMKEGYQCAGDAVQIRQEFFFKIN
jgi:protein TonB